MAEPMTRTRLLSIDAMRGLAALTVLCHHIEREYGLSFGFPYGYLAVDLFFLMSGFVIAGAYEPRMNAHMGPLSFLAIRLKRLYPMIFLGALLGVGAAWSRHASPLTLIWGGLSALTMVPLLWSADVLFPINIPEWSLFFEIVANLLHRILRPILNLGGIGLCLGLSVLGLLLAGWKLHGLANGWSPATFWGGLPRALFSYFLGVLLYRLTAKGWLHAPTLPLPLPMLAFIAVVLLEAVVGRRVPASAYWLAAIAVAFPILFLFTVQARAPKAFAKFASGLGDLSYPLYAVHVPLLVLADPLVLHFTGPARIAAAAVAAGAVVVIALLLNAVYDRPVRRMLEGRRRDPAPETEVQIAAP
jgi:peptidoglycan/LPS O-acetylase OafA/YrhL